MFAAPVKKEKINDLYNLAIHHGGLLAPPNLFFLTKRTGLIFDKQFHLSSSENFSKISKLEILGFKENESIICRIYMDNNKKVIVDTLQYHE